MKKIISVILSIIILSSVTLMSGCSDFEFNPIGKWHFTDNILYYTDGSEIAHTTYEDMMYQTYYIFEKSGTGYILVDNKKTLKFTYEYDSENIVITYTNLNEEYSANNSQTFTVSDIENQLINTQQNNYIDEDGSTITLSEDIILTRT